MCLNLCNMMNEFPLYSNILIVGDGNFDASSICCSYFIWVLTGCYIRGKRIGFPLDKIDA